MNRWKAGLVHLAISLAVAAAVYVAVRFLWYPGPLFELAGGLELLVIVISVDVTLGPLVTLIVFKPGKWGLEFDLWFIGTVQILALAYGVYSIAESRPVFITFVKDRFELVRAGELDDADLAEGTPGFNHLPWFGYRLAGAQLPRDAREQMKHLDLAIMGSKDIHLFPRLYVPYAQVGPQAARAGQPLERLRKYNPDRLPEVDALMADRDLAFLPMRAGKHDMTVVVRRPGGEVVSLSTLKPWDQ